MAVVYLFVSPCLFFFARTPFLIELGYDFFFGLNNFFTAYAHTLLYIYWKIEPPCHEKVSYNHMTYSSHIILFAINDIVEDPSWLALFN